MRIRPLCSDPCRGELLTDRAALGQGCSRTELLTDRAALGQTFRPAQGRVQNLPVFSGAQWPPCPGTETDAHCFGPVRPSRQVSLSRSGTSFAERRGCATLSGDRDRCALLQCPCAPDRWYPRPSGRSGTDSGHGERPAPWIRPADVSSVTACKLLPGRKENSSLRRQGKGPLVA